MNDIKALTDRLFRSDGRSFIEVLYELGELERMIVALEKHVPAAVLEIDTPESNIPGISAEDGRIFHNVLALIQGSNAPGASVHAAEVQALRRQLAHTVFSVKEWELQYEVQVQLWKEKEQLAKTLSKSSDQFTYGSTSFAFWCALCTSDGWKAHIRAYIQRAQLAKIVAAGDTAEGPTIPLRVCVFGSSQGLLAYFTAVCVLLEFYCAIYGGSTSVAPPVEAKVSTEPDRVAGASGEAKVSTEPDRVSGASGEAKVSTEPDRVSGASAEEATANFPPGWSMSDLAVVCEGCEVMPLLFARAELVGRGLSAPGASVSVSFHLLDMLAADVSAMDVVVLTSLCWDKSTRKAVALKLHRELKPGALVVEYTADLFKAAGVDADGIPAVPTPADTTVQPDAAPLGSAASVTKEGVLFKLHSILQGECTWNTEQKLFLFHTIGA